MLPLIMCDTLISEFSKLSFIIYSEQHRKKGIGGSTHEAAELRDMKQFSKLRDVAAKQLLNFLSVVLRKHCS